MQRRRFLEQRQLELLGDAEEDPGIGILVAADPLPDQGATYLMPGSDGPGQCRLPAGSLAGAYEELPYSLTTGLVHPGYPWLLSVAAG